VLSGKSKDVKCTRKRKKSTLSIDKLEEVEESLECKDTDTKPSNGYTSNSNNLVSATGKSTTMETRNDEPENCTSLEAMRKYYEKLVKGVKHGSGLCLSTVLLGCSFADIFEWQT
jgi:hypothetical protein